MARPDRPGPDPSGPAVHAPVENPGPFEDERQVRELPAVQAVYAAFRADPGVGKMTPHIMSMLYDALAAAGVYLGAYDHRIVEWLANWEPQTVAVIAGWVQRASQADGEAAARADQLLAKMRDGPPGHAQEDHRTARPQRRRDAEAICVQGNAGGDDGRAPREEAP